MENSNKIKKITTLDDLTERFFEIDNMLYAGEITKKTAIIKKKKAVDELNSVN